MTAWRTRQDSKRVCACLTWQQKGNSASPGAVQKKKKSRAELVVLAVRGATEGTTATR